MLRGCSTLRSLMPRRVFSATGASMHALSGSAGAATRAGMHLQHHAVPSLLLSPARFSTAAEGESSKDTQTSDNKEDGANEETEEHRLQKEISELKEQLEVKSKETADMKARALAALADAENARKRAQKDVADARDFALTKFAKNLLEVTDTLELAVKSIKAEEQNEQIANLLEGVEMTSTILHKAFNDAGISKFESVGEKFDPNIHDGAFQYEDPTNEPGTVGQCMKDGYMINGRVLRPAQVGTIKAPAKSA